MRRAARGSRGGRRAAPIIETVVTTINPDGSVNCGAMGVEWGAERIVIKPFRGTRTLRNLRATGAAVVNLTDDILLFSQAALGDPHPPTHPAAGVEGAVLDDACSWREVRVEAIDDGAQRARVSTVVVGGGSGREFLGFNRARHAVLEASILASRVRLLDAEEIRAELRPAAGARGQDGRAARARGDGVRSGARAAESSKTLDARFASRRRRACTWACSRSPATARGASAGSASRSAAPRSCSRREPAGELSAEGPDAERALAFARRCHDALGLDGRRASARGRGDPAARRPRLGHEAGARRRPGAGRAGRARRRRARASPRRRGGPRGRRWACGRSRSAASWSRAGTGRASSARRRCWRATRCPRSGGRCSSCPRPSPGCRAAPRRRRSRGWCRRPSARRRSRSSC